jgi:rubredoxin
MDRWQCTICGNLNEAECVDPAEDEEDGWAPAWLGSAPVDFTTGPPMEIWQCLACGYVYDEEIGDPMNGVMPSRAFAGLPEAWVCPVCGGQKSLFEKI